MVKLLSSSAILNLDAESPSHGVPSEKLMRQAAQFCADWIEKHFSKQDKIAIVCGPGNNGGDGKVLAKILKQNQFSEVHVFEKVDFDKFHKSDWHWSLIVDALFGIGLNRTIVGAEAKLIRSINSSGSFVLSLDVPSGLNAMLGESLVEGSEKAVRADVTITFGFAKPGLFLKDGPALRGQLIVAPIGYPSQLIKPELFRHFLITRNIAKKWIPKRKTSANKAKNGRAFLISGSAGMWGAALLAGRAASRVGAGYVEILSDEKFPIQKQPEFLTANWSLEKIKNATAIAIGPGLKVDSQLESQLQDLNSNYAGPVIADASALSALAKKPFSLARNWVLTPHAGELSRLIGLGATEIERDPFAALSIACSKYKCWILLKGYHSILSNGEKFYIVNSGNPALSKAGSGDVLTGMILGFLAQGLSVAQATLLAAYLHGWLADQWIQDKSELSLMPSDLVGALPRALNI